MVHRFVMRSRQTRRSDLGKVAGKGGGQIDSQCDKTLPILSFWGRAIVVLFHLVLVSQPLARQRNLTSLPVLPRYRKVKNILYISYKLLTWHESCRPIQETSKARCEARMAIAIEEAAIDFLRRPNKEESVFFI